MGGTSHRAGGGLWQSGGRASNKGHKWGAVPILVVAVYFVYRILSEVTLSWAWGSVLVGCGAPGGVLFPVGLGFVVLCSAFRLFCFSLLLLSLSSSTLLSSLVVLFVLLILSYLLVLFVYAYGYPIQSLSYLPPMRLFILLRTLQGILVTFGIE